MKAIQEFLAAWPAVWTALETLCILIPMAALLAYSGIGFVSALAGILARARGRASFDKCARQLALLGFVLGWTLLIGSRIWLFLARMDAGKPAACAWMAEACWFLLAGSVLVTSLYYALWKPVSKHPAAAAVLGISAGLAACAALVAALATARCHVLGPQIPLAGGTPETAALLLKNFLMPENNMAFWNALWYTPALIAAFSAGIGSLWLFACRRRDDFGRDHYNAMIAWCARLSRNAWGLLWMLLLVFDIFRLRLSSLDIPDDIWPGIATETAYLLYWAIPALLWTFVGRSAAPLRHGATLLAALCAAGTFLVPYYLEICAI
ncbi:MAG: hypothetical protein LBQ10_09215 [Desulfovibrio sp.]|jgi:hypothetical protein|nr:hypothetical protein [Desulfovibrio sp.]